jgi:hypothetical protein
MVVRLYRNKESGMRDLAIVLLVLAAGSAFAYVADDSEWRWQARAEARERAREAREAAREQAHVKREVRRAQIEAKRAAVRDRLEFARERRDYLREQGRIRREAVREFERELRYGWRRID